MSSKLIFLFIIPVFIMLPVNSQGINNRPGTEKKNYTFRKTVLPSTLLIMGLIINNSQMEINTRDNIRKFTGDNYELRLDDYLQYAPAAEIFIADITGIKSKNHWFDQTKNLLIADITTSIIVQALKAATGKSRPNGAPYSFPSGHTSFAFSNATVLLNEFNESSKILAYSGYAFSTTTGIFRMVNNKHWLSDVLFGAGTGIIVAQLVYHFDPLIKWNPFKHTQNIIIIPSIQEIQKGFYFSYQF